MTGDTYGWSIFKPTDEVKTFDGTSENWYVLRCNNKLFPIEGQWLALR